MKDFITSKTQGYVSAENIDNAFTELFMKVDKEIPRERHDLLIAAIETCKAKILKKTQRSKIAAKVDTGKSPESSKTVVSSESWKEKSAMGLKRQEMAQRAYEEACKRS